MSIRYEYYIIGGSGYISIYNDQWIAQTFTPSISHEITSVKLRLLRLANPGTFTVSIKATDDSGHPTGADLCFGTTDSDTLPTGSPYEWREITFSSTYPLLQNTKYAIVARATDGDVNNFVGWRVNTFLPAYAGGSYVGSNDSGSSWISVTSIDCMFEEWGSLVSSGRDIQSNTPVRRIAGGNKFPYKFPFRFKVTITPRTVKP